MEPELEEKFHEIETQLQLIKRDIEMLDISFRGVGEGFSNCCDAINDFYKKLDKPRKPRVIKSIDKDSKMERDAKRTQRGPKKVRKRGRT